MWTPTETLLPAAEHTPPPQTEARPGRGLHVLVLPSWYATTVVPQSGIFFKEQAQALRAAGVRVGVVHPNLRRFATARAGTLGHNRFQREWREEEGIPTLRYYGWAPPKLHTLSRWLFVRYALDLFERYAARCGRPDLVHAHSAFLAGAGALAIRRRFGVPYVLTEHSTHYGRGLIRPWQRAGIRGVIEGAARVIAVGEALRDQMRPYAGAAAPAIGVVPNLVDTAFFTPPPGAAAAARERGEDAAPFRFLAIGGLFHHKGYDVLLRAFAAAFAAPAAGQGEGAAEDVELEIGGAGPARGALEDLARTLGLAGRVRFLGQLSREEVRSALWRADRFVLASRIETFGVVLIEAMATGLPVIATRCGVPEEVVDPAVGALVAPDDPAALAGALGEAVRRRAPWRARAGAIRAHAVERFGRDAVAERLIACYRDALARAPAP